MRASDVANMMAPPTPWAARDRLSMSGVVASPHVSDAMEKSTSPRANIPARPYMSPSTPAVSRKAARVRA